MTKLQISTGAVFVIVAAAALILWQRDKVGRLEAVNSALQEELAQLGQENQSLADAAKSSTSLSQDDLRDLMRLRAEATLMSETEQENARLRAERDGLKAQLAQSSKAVTPERPPERTPEEMFRMRKVSFAKQLGVALYLYADDYGRFPPNFEVTAAYTNGIQKFRGIRDDQFEIVYQGPKLKNPAQEIILMKEKEPTRRADGLWEKVYLFCDGHVEVPTTDNGNFDSWEREHSVESVSP